MLQPRSWMAESSPQLTALRDISFDVGEASSSG